MIETERLILREWKSEDRAPFARLNADPKVREFFPGTLSAEESDRTVDRIEAHFRQHGFGFYAAEVKESGCFAGFIGIGVVPFEAHFTPAVEIGWRLSCEYWGKGLATEGARAVLKYAFDVLGLEEVVAFTVPTNDRSRRVMEKLGMTVDEGADFDHPNVPEDYSLRRHVLYRIRREDFNV